MPPPTFRNLCLFPIQGAFFPFVGKTDDENGEKNHDRDKTSHTHFMQRYRPRKEERDFKIEKNEKNGHEVIAHIEFHARILESFKTTFVGGVFRRIWAIGAQDVSESQRHNANGDADQNEQKDGEVLIEVHLGDVLTAAALPARTRIGSLQEGLCFGAVGETRTRTAFATTPSR